MITSVREACLGARFPAAVALTILAGCGGGANGVPPRTAAVLALPAASGAGIVRALGDRGVTATLVEAAADPGGDALATARRALLHAAEAQQSFHEAEAVESLARAEALAGAGPVGAAERAVLAEVGFLRAWLHLSAGRAEEAEHEAVRASIFADPGAPDPARYPPEVLALFARVTSAPRATGTLRVEVRGGERAEVRLDGRALGAAPLDAGGLVAGTHTVAIESAGHVPIGDRVEVPASGRVVRTYTLAPLGPPALARQVLSARGRAQLDAAGALAATLSVDGVLLAREARDARGVGLAARWVTEQGEDRVVEGRGADAAAAAAALARRLTARRGGGSGPPAVLWIVGGAVVAAAVVGVVVAVWASGDGGGDQGGSVRCCAVR